VTALRHVGLLLALVVGLACGWRAAQSDLLAWVIRGAAAWLGLVVLWMAGVSACERLVKKQMTDDR